MLSHLGLVTLLVHDMNDMPRTKAFYSELLGFEVVPEFSAPAGFFVFLHSKTGNANIALIDVTKTAGKPAAAVPEESGGTLLGFLVEDADAVYRDWQSKGVEILSGMVDMSLSHLGKGRTFGAKDPAGNYIQIYHLDPQARALQEQLG